VRKVASNLFAPLSGWLDDKKAAVHVPGLKWIKGTLDKTGMRLKISLGLKTLLYGDFHPAASEYLRLMFFLSFLGSRNSFF